MKDNDHITVDIDEIFDMEAIKGLVSLFVTETRKNDGVLEATLYDAEGYAIPVADIDNIIYKSKVISMPCEPRNIHLYTDVMNEFIFTVYDFLEMTRGEGYTAKLVMKTFNASSDDGDITTKTLKWEAKNGMLYSWRPETIK